VPGWQEETTAAETMNRIISKGSTILITITDIPRRCNG